MTPENYVFKQTYNANFNDAKQLSPLALSWLCKRDTNVIHYRPFHVFFLTFSDMDKLRKICLFRWKECL